MSYSNKYYEVMALLGCGYSVATICDKANISFDELCELAGEYNELKIELDKWFPKFDFTVKPKKEAVKVTENDTSEEEKNDISAGKQVSRKPKGKSK